MFVAHRETLEWLRTALSHRAQLATAVFHEELSTARRDIEVAQFRLAEGPSLLVSTECGGEGRNFEFCRRLVLFDLPWNPLVVEQRIGRLDRIGRRLPVEVVYFRPARGHRRATSRGSSRRSASSASRSPASSPSSRASRPRSSWRRSPRRDRFRPSATRAIVGGARAAQSRIREAA